jgi:hypothetical protein
MNRREPKEFEKFVDDAIVYRELETTTGRLRFSLFITALSPILMGLLYVTKKLPPAKPLLMAILAAPAIGIVLMLIHYGRAPEHAKKHKTTLQILLYTSALAVGAYVLAGYFSLLRRN